MQSGLDDQALDATGFAETTFERLGMRLDLGAPVTGAVTVGERVAVSCGDGFVRFFEPGRDPVSFKVHDGVVLAIAATGDSVLTGGDDGKFMSISPNGAVHEIDDFCGRWVDCVAASDTHIACSSGKTALVWKRGEQRSISLTHPSTVGGLAFDDKGKRLAVTHYGGATIWEQGERRWKSSKLIWKGSHGHVLFSPDGKYVLTSMQENALHGWRIRSKAHFAMGGYPAKIKSMAWAYAADVPYLVTSGAGEAVCWPFDGKDGPAGRSPLCVAPGGGPLVSCVAAFPGTNAVFAGFRDGAVLLAELDDMAQPLALRGSNGAEVTAIAVLPSGSHVFIGDAGGNGLWAPFSEAA